MDNDRRACLKCDFAGLAVGLCLLLVAVYRHPAKPTAESLPSAELSKVNASTSMSDRGRITCQLYNGSNWELKDITLNAKIYDYTYKLLTERKYTLLDYPPVLPNASRELHGQFGPWPQDGSKVEWELVTATGWPH
jgi:hypothetical protein